MELKKRLCMLNYVLAARGVSMRMLWSVEYEYVESELIGGE